MTKEFAAKEKLEFVLGTLFKHVVGISAKESARLYRLKHVLHSIDPTQPTNWTLMAQQSGYYDQPRFNHDFAAFLGLSPTDYLQLRCKLHSEDPGRDRLLHVLPID